MQDDFDGGAGIPDDELGGGPIETGEPMGMPEAEGEGDASQMPAGRPSGGARKSKSSGGSRKSGGRKAARKGGGKKKAAKKKPARKAAKKSKKRAGSKK
ncbi:MAG TPA: hypothetical protein VEU08_21985 [Vicinamibacterales bacterium]|nr:hypothetical protein [Vicinamibacterales bacterium]